MPPGQVTKKPAPTTTTAGDLIGALPDAILQHVLSFLPAQEVVRTCVLARRWRHLWEDATGLRITAGSTPEPPVAPDVSAGELREFVDHLLLLRGRAPLDTCEFMLDVRDDGDVTHVNLWIRHVVLCQVRRLQLGISRENDGRGIHFYVDKLPLISRHLMRLELYHTGLNDSFLDFSGCPELEYLLIYNGRFFSAKKILSKSVKHLSVMDSEFNRRFRTRIEVPNTISLRLEEDPWTRTPVLGSTPSLVEALVRLGTECDISADQCDNSDSGNCDDEHCEGCYSLEGDNSNYDTGSDTNRNKSVILHGLSEAKSLVLIDEWQTYIFKRDLKWCPTFRQLKTLLLNHYWCAPPNFRALACILEHSPVLEVLTLHIFSKGPEQKVEIKGSHCPTDKSAAISKSLSLVEVKCEVVDERVLKVLNFLGTHDIYFNYEEESTTS